ncbi:MAG: hypothetical protein R2766_11420 [Saprospiraceae bacterium]
MKHLQNFQLELLSKNMGKTMTFKELDDYSKTLGLISDIGGWNRGIELRL